jgi:type II secretory pathway pseudopilin PulG
MPNGERPSRRAAQRGFTYLLLLFVLAIAGAGLAVMGEQWALAGQREREAELSFRGTQFARALASWRDATPGGQPGAPSTLQELLQDERGEPPLHHLRKLFIDPFTGQADWELLRDERGRIRGLASRSRQPALGRRHAVLRADAQAHAPRVGDWVFEAEGPAARASAPAVKGPP